MLDLFTIFSKSGIVLWCFQGTNQLFTPSVNALIRTVLLQERSGSNIYDHNGLTLKYRLDNEFELVFVVGYQKILQLSYIDKFLDDVHLEFRDKYKDELMVGNYFLRFQFTEEFQEALRLAEEYGRALACQPKKMRTFEESQKSKKTIASMIENLPLPTKGKSASRKQDSDKKKTDPKLASQALDDESIAAVAKDAGDHDGNSSGKASVNGSVDIDAMMKLRQKKNKAKKTEKSKSPTSSKDKSKQPRIWNNSGTAKEMSSLDFSKKQEGGAEPMEDGLDRNEYIEDRSLIGQMKGELKGMDYSSESEEEEVKTKSSAKSAGGGGMFSMFRSLVGSKSISKEDMVPILNKLRDHMIAKNVAADIADKLCESVAAKLEGKVLGTFTGVASTVRNTLSEALVQLLSPKRRIDILRDVLESRTQKKPYVMTFCGVNGVGKSTNLAKIAFWLTENGFRVLIAACDTFRAGAVEQLRTHTRHLNALHPPEQHGGQQMVQLYEKGYGKDAAGIAMEAINYARDARIDVVLVDTAGRMQDNEPLMRALAKLIKVNCPDLVLFVGEALVGNEAIDQLVKFNQALADHSSQDRPHLIDGIVLTKFDTIDDKVGAAISMTYITGQPIVFVGTGQTYTDLKTLNPKAVVHALMK